jgi:hypothetical protein
VNEEIIGLVDIDNLKLRMLARGWKNAPDRDILSIVVNSLRIRLTANQVAIDYRALRVVPLGAHKIV